MTSVPPAVGRLTQCRLGPSAARSSSRTRGSRARFWSILLTTTMRARPSSPAALYSRRVARSMPAPASVTSTAVSTAGRAASAWPTKSGCPGVSMMLISRPSLVANRSVALIEWWCFWASGSKSLMVFEASTDPIRVIAPSRWSSASASVVLPAPARPMRAMLRMSCGRKLGTEGMRWPLASTVRTAHRCRSRCAFDHAGSRPASFTWDAPPSPTWDAVISHVGCRHPHVRRAAISHVGRAAISHVGRAANSHVRRAAIPT